MVISCAFDTLGQKPNLYLLLYNGKRDPINPHDGKGNHMEFSGLELFLDDQMISNTRNMCRRITRPRLYEGNPVVRREYPWEAGHACIYGSVLYDDNKKLFRMWYNAYGEDYYNQQVMAYAESPDGITWTKPMLDVRPWPGYERTNILMGPQINLHGPGLLVNPDQSDPQRRYLMLFDSYPHWRPDATELGIHGRQLYAAESPDGIHWSPDMGRPAFAGKADSGQSVVWDPVTKTFKAYVRMTIEDAFGQRIRGSRLVESPDFVHWGPPRELMRTDDVDGYPDAQIQQLCVTRLDGIYVGLLSMFQIQQYVHGTERRKEGGGGLFEGAQVSEIQLVTSRDGVHFTRVADRSLFMAQADRGGFGTHGYTTASQMLQHDDTVYIYCDGRMCDPDDPDWIKQGMEIGLATMPRDRFVALQPKRMMDEAMVELVPMQFPQARLLLNATTSAAGQIRAELADFNGVTIKGFEHKKSVIITGESLDHQIFWQADGKTYMHDALPPNMRDQPIRLRLWLRQAHIHALRASS